MQATWKEVNKALTGPDGLWEGQDEDSLHGKETYTDEEEEGWLLVFLGELCVECAL